MYAKFVNMVNEFNNQQQINVIKLISIYFKVYLWKFEIGALLNANKRSRNEFPSNVFY